eukprot:scaffold95338_cov39-Prasinocladus_malaysianus.AAC.1
MMAWMQLAINPCDDRAFERALFRPPRKGWKLQRNQCVQRLANERRAMALAPNSGSLYVFGGSAKLYFDSQ